MSKRMWMTAAVGPLALVALTFAAGHTHSQAGGQAEAPQSTPGLTRVPPLEEGQTQIPGSPAFDGKLWTERLKLEDLGQRELFFGELVDLAREDSGAALWLREQASTSTDRELAWTCRLALREVFAARHQQRRAARDRLAPSLFGPGFGSVQASPEMQQQLERLRLELEQMMGPRGTGLQGFGPGIRFQQVQPGQGSSNSVRVQSGPDGTTVEITEVVDGEPQTRSYTGESMEALIEQHPELEQSLGGLRFGAGSGPGAGFFGGGPNVFRWQLGGGGTPSQQPVTRTDVLGVVVRELTDAQSAARGLPPGALLLVERVEPGTIAAAVGLGPGDALLEMNGSALTMIPDIASALELRPATGELDLVWIDSLGRRQERSWRPAEQK